MSDVRLMLGDCLSLLREIPDNSVDAVVTDPPYSSGGAFRGDRLADPNSSAKYVANKTKAIRRSFHGDTRDQLGYLTWLGVWLSMCHRATKPGGLACVFSDWRQIAATINAIQVGGWVYRGIVVWDKTEAALPLAARFRAQSEFVVWGTKGPRPKIPGVGCHAGVFRLRNGIHKQHIAEKPVELMSRLIANTPAGASVLDPFMGSGSTGVACLQAGRSFIGIEIDPDDFAIATQRIQAMQAEPALFASPDRTGAARP